MKKLLAVLLALVMVLSLVACGAAPAEPPNTPAEPETPATEEPAAEPETPAATGSVYYLNFKPESDAAWQELAKTYTEQTGVPVKVVTAASGTYDTTLAAELDKSSAPTLFQCGNQGAINSYGDYCYPLDGTAIMDQMTTDAFNLKGEDGQTLSIGYCYEAFGIIVNKALLEKAGHSIDEITNFDSLKAVADDIHARADELGFDAFSSAGLDGSSSWRFSGHLANMPLFYEFRDDGVTAQPATITGAYLNNFKNIWDLYITDSTCDPADLASKKGTDAETEFTSGEAVFFQNGSWEYSIVTKAGMKDDELGMLPIYIGAGDEANQGLCTGSENYWCVNNKASADDQAATLEFLNWCVTNKTGTSALADDMGFVIPFKNAKEATNVFVKIDNELTAAGKTPVSWNFTTMPSEDWKNGVGTALTQYAAGTGDWDGLFLYPFVSLALQFFLHSYSYLFY